MGRIKYNRLKLLLTLHEKSSKQLALHLGVSVATVSKWCTNRSQPDVPMLFKIVLFLDIEIEELLTDPRMIIEEIERTKKKVFNISAKGLRASL